MGVGLRKKLRGGGYAGEGKEDKIRRGGCCEKKIEGGKSERVKKMKCGGRVKFIFGGSVRSHKKSRGGGSVENYVFFRGVKY